MSIESQQIVIDRPEGNGRRVVYEFTDHLGNKWQRHNKHVDISFDANADMLSLIPAFEEELAEDEILEAVDTAQKGINPDKVPEHQTQAEFDRRVLAALMRVDDLNALVAGHGFFLAQEIRNGNNNTARAATLGVLKTEYDQVDSRLSIMAGIKGSIATIQDEAWINGPPSEDWS